MRVVVNAAVSADGKLSTRRREQVAISGPGDFTRVDRLRAASDAVMVGVGTVFADDPSLTVDDPDLRAERTAAGRSAQPARVVADSRARTPPDARVLDDRAESYVLVGPAAPADRIAALETRATVVATGGGDDGRGAVDTGSGGSGAADTGADGSHPDEAGGEPGDSGVDGPADRVDLAAALDRLAADGVEQLMVEGGGELIFSLFAAGLVDELSVYVGPQVIGGRDAPTLADGEGFLGSFPRLELHDVERLDDGVVLFWRAGNGQHS